MENRITITLEDYFNGGYTLPQNIDKFIELEISDVKYNIKDMFTKLNLYKEIGSETQELFKHNLDILIDDALALYNPQLKLLKDNFDTLMARKVTEISSGENSQGIEETNSKNNTENKDIQETSSVTGGNNSSKTNETDNYLNPANTDSTKLKDKTLSGTTENFTTNGESEYTHDGETTSSETGQKNVVSNSHFTESRERTFGYFRSNPEILQKANECFDLVSKILTYLDRAFIGEY